MAHPHQAEPVAAAPHTTRAQEMLLAFLRDHDAECPVCGYNVRAITRPVCPECKQHLTLTVGAQRLGLGWLIIALAPGFFSGIAAGFVLIPIVGRLFFGDGVFMPLMAALDLFGWASGIFTLFLAFGRGGRLRTRFLARPRAQQRTFAFIIWFIHIAALGAFIYLAAMFT